MFKKTSFNQLLFFYAISVFIFKGLFQEFDLLVFALGLGIIVCTGTLLYMAVKAVCKKDYSRLVKLTLVLPLVVLLPTELIYSVASLPFNYSLRNKIVHELQDGQYDSIMRADAGFASGTWIYKCARHYKVYKRNNIKMVFLEQRIAGYTGEEFFGLQYVNGESTLTQLEVREFNYSSQCIPLGGHWYWVRYLPDYTPAP